MDRRPEDRLALIELIDRDGRVRRAVDVHDWPVRLGRALDNTVVLDDPHVAAHHATLLADEQGRLRVEAGASLNGVALGKRRLQAGDSATLAADAALLLGTQRLRVRLAGGLAGGLAGRLPVGLAGDPPSDLPAELPLAAPGLGMGALAALAATWLAWQVAQRWVQLDPGADLEKWLPWLLGLPTGLAVWSGAWALGSKLFRHGFDFSHHAAIALSVMLGYEVLDMALPLLAATADLPLLAMVWRQWGAPLAVAVLLRAHLRQLLPQRPRTVNANVLALLLASLAVTSAVNWRQQGRLLSEPYMASLPLPALRWGPVSDPKLLDADLARLRPVLEERVKQSADDEPEDEPAER